MGHQTDVTLNDRKLYLPLTDIISLVPSKFYAMENVTIFIFWLSQKPDVTMSAFPLMSSLSQSDCISDVLLIIDVVEGRGRVSRAG